MTHGQPLTYRYRFPYGWGNVSTTRCQPNIISHAVVLDRARDDKAIEVEWCGSFAIAVRERLRQMVTHMGDDLSQGPLPSITIHVVEETVV